MSMQQLWSPKFIRACYSLLGLSVELLILYFSQHEWGLGLRAMFWNPFPDNNWNVSLVIPARERKLSFAQSRKSLPMNFARPAKGLLGSKDAWEPCEILVTFTSEMNPMWLYARLAMCETFSEGEREKRWALLTKLGRWWGTSHRRAGSDWLHLPGQLCSSSIPSVKTSSRSPMGPGWGAGRIFKTQF